MDQKLTTCSRSVPRVSYVTCLDLWMVACIIFVFIELIEFSIIFLLNKTNFTLIAEKYTNIVYKQQFSKVWHFFLFIIVILQLPLKTVK